jgi:hypothetical protein
MNTRQGMQILIDYFNPIEISMQEVTR